MEKYINLAKLVATQVANGFRTTEGLPNWFKKLVDEEVAKIQKELEDFKKEIGLSD